MSVSGGMPADELAAAARPTAILSHDRSNAETARLDPRSDFWSLAAIYVIRKPAYSGWQWASGDGWDPTGAASLLASARWCLAQR
jgi:hypothetical protein